MSKNETLLNSDFLALVDDIKKRLKHGEKDIKLAEEELQKANEAFEATLQKIEGILD